MTDVAAWLGSRTPAPPADLAAGLRRGAATDGSLVEALTAAGIDRLGAARDAPGRVRESAFRLLEADALLTYACEAALETEHPADELQRVLAAIGR